MQLNQEILLYLLKRENLDLKRDFDSECYRALAEIRDIIRDDTLNDEDCFLKIEKIVSIFEEIGSGGGVRHDFG